MTPVRVEPLCAVRPANARAGRALTATLRAVGWLGLLLVTATPALPLDHADRNAGSVSARVGPPDAALSTPGFTVRPVQRAGDVGVQALNDTLPLALYEYEDPNGVCQSRDWVAQERAGTVYAHVSSRFVVNASGINMGTRALWFGADSTSAPDEVADWVQPYGYGDNWSQRLTSPKFHPLPNDSLTFDLQLSLGTGVVVDADREDEFFAVQALDSTGNWRFLRANYRPLDLAAFVGTAIAGNGLMRVRVLLDVASGNFPGLADSTRLRIVVQTDSAASMIDGLVAADTAAALVDNIQLRRGGVAITPATNFESGTTGLWTLSAVNGSPMGAFILGTALRITRDRAIPNTIIAPHSAVDPIDPTCVWTFRAAGDTLLPPGTFSRMVSPWMAIGDRTKGLELAFEGRFPLRPQGYGLIVGVRTKNAGERRPHATYLLYSSRGGQGADDADSPWYRFTSTFPTAFGWPITYQSDSLKFIFEIQDRGEVLGADIDARPRTKFPIVDRAGFAQAGIDQDQDGIIDSGDACIAISAAGQDADRDGCPDGTASMRHVESWQGAAPTLHYSLSRDSVSGITDGSDSLAIRQAFAAWAGIAGSQVTLVEDARNPRRFANALDGLNLVTFQDDPGFPPGVLALTPTTSFTRARSFDDRIIPPGEIVDSDILVNPAALFRTPTGGNPAGFDLQSVVTHEVGHLLGLSHSGVERATMFPVLPGGTAAASLENDDRAALCAAYPTSALTSNFGAIHGRVRRGAGGSPVPGALVTAVRLGAGNAPVDTVASDLTAEDGTFHLRRLAAGNYGVHISPLDGSIPGVVPGAINQRVLQSAVTNFQSEWWSGVAESDSDDVSVLTPVPAAPGSAFDSAVVIVNIDRTPPIVLRAVPGNDSTQIRTDTAVLVDFSEPIDLSSLKSAFELRVQGQPAKLGGRGQLVNDQRFVFVPTSPLAYDTPYELKITTVLLDRAGVPLAATYVTRFRTEARSTVAVSASTPPAAPVGGVVTLIGAGFDPANPAGHFVRFAGCAGCGVVEAPALRVTPRSVVVRVPAGAVSGHVRVRFGAELSSPDSLTVLGDTTFVPLRAFGAGVPLHAQPMDVAFAKDGRTAFVASEDGLEVVGLDQSVEASFLQATEHRIGGGTQLLMAPDGRRAYLLQPQLGRLAVISTVPAEAAYAEVLETFEVGAVTHGAMSRDGRIVWATVPGRDSLYGIDVDVASLTRGEVVRAVRAVGASEAVEVHYSSLRDACFLLDASGSILEVALDTDSSRVLRGAGLLTYGLALSPDEGTVWAAIQGGFLNGPPGTLADPALRDIGSVWDIAPTVDGRRLVCPSWPLHTGAGLSVFETGGLQLRQELAGSTHAQSIAANPVGRIFATIEAGVAALRVFTQASTSSLAVLEQAGGVPGDVVAVTVPDTAGLSAATVRIGSQSAAVLGRNGATLQVGVPEMPPGTTALVVQRPNLVEGTPAPFVVHPTPTTLASRATLTRPSTITISCQSGGTAPLRIASVGMSERNGQLLVQFGPPRDTTCSVALQPISGISSIEQREGQLFPYFSDIGSVSTSRTIVESRASSDGRFLWMLTTSASQNRMECLVGNPDDVAYGQLYAWADAPVASTPVALAMFGARVATGWSNGNIMVHAAPTQFGPLAPALDTIALTPHVAKRLEISRDGGLLIIAGEDRMWFFDLAASAMVASSPPRATMFVALALTGDGTRVVGRALTGEIGVWNLDPQRGPIGHEDFFGALARLTGGSRAICMGTTPAEILAGLADRDSLAAIALDTSAPTVRFLPGSRTADPMAVSADRHQLFVVKRASTPSNPDSIKVLDLTTVSRLLATSGDAQVGAPDTRLAAPLRVRLLDSQERGIGGAIVRFEPPDALQGSLDEAAAGQSVVHVTDAQGEASARWTMPAGVRSVRMRVLAPGISDTVTFEANSASQDSTAVPVILSFGPSPGAAGLDPATSFFIRFNQRMDSTSVAQRLFVFFAGIPVAGRLTVEDGGRLMLFRPTNALPFGGLGMLKLFYGATDREGQILADSLQSTFTIQSAPSLSLESVTPPAAPVGAPVVITGQGFSLLPSQNSVFINGISASVQAVAENGIVIRVPVGAIPGDLWVRVAAQESNRLGFTVLERDTGSSAVSDSLVGQAGARDVAVTPDGLRAYVTQPALNIVLGMRLDQLVVIAAVPVGQSPEAIAILGGSAPRAYVANRGGDDVSVIDVRPGSPTDNRVVGTVHVGHEPVAVAGSAVGPRVFVANRGSGTLSVIDARSTSATFHQVVSTVNTGSGTKGVTITPDGGLAVVSTTTGLVIVDVANHAVVSTVNTGSGTKSVAITPDGTLALALTDDGRLVVVVLAAGPLQYQVVSTVNTGSGTKGVTITPDGGLAIVLRVDGGLLVFRIEGGVLLPDGSLSGEGVALAASDSVDVGGGTEGIALDPLGGFAIVVNPQTGVVSRIELPRLAVALRTQVETEHVTLGPSYSRARVFLQPDTPFVATHIVRGSIRVGGLPLVDTTSVQLGDSNGDGRPDMIAMFERDSLVAKLVESDSAIVVVTGKVDGRIFTGRDWVRARSTRITAPAQDAVVPPGARFRVEWQRASTHAVQAAVLVSSNGGRTWLLESKVPNTGVLLWTAPSVLSDSVRLAIVEMDSVLSDTLVIGPTGHSARFRIATVTGTLGPVTRLTLAPIRPDPAPGVATLRFGLPAPNAVSLEIFDVQGRLVRTLVRGRVSAGWHELSWGGDAAEGRMPGAGVYFARLRRGSEQVVRRFVMLR